MWESLETFIRSQGLQNRFRVLVFMGVYGMRMFNGLSKRTLQKGCYQGAQGLKWFLNKLFFREQGLSDVLQSIFLSTSTGHGLKLGNMLGII